MKNYLYTYFTVVPSFFFSNFLFAQKQISEGSIEYAISISSAKDNKTLDKFNGATLKLFVRPGLSRTIMQSSLGTEATVFNSNLGKGFILKEYSGQKLLITMTKANWVQKNQWNNNLNFSVDANTVELNGYSCKKATANTPDGKTFTVYFTPSITITNTDYNNAFKLPGLPVQYEIQSGNLTFKYSLVNVTEQRIDAALFEEPKSGYRVMTYDEGQQMKQGN